MGRHGGLFAEEIDTADTLEEADYLLKEYQLAFGTAWELWIDVVAEEKNPFAFCQCLAHRNPKVVEIDRPGRPKPEKCEAPGCVKTTQKGKNRCTDHIEDTAYAQRLADRMSRMREEEERASKGKIKFSPDSENTKEILLLLSLHGSKTVARLARDTNHSIAVIEGYVKALVKAKLVTTEMNKRGATVVSMVIP